MNNDILHCAQDFAEHLNVPVRRAYYLLENGLIPAGKLGDKWIGRKSRLDAHIDAQLDAETLARAHDGGEAA